MNHHKVSWLSFQWDYEELPSNTGKQYAWKHFRFRGRRPHGAGAEALGHLITSLRDTETECAAQQEGGAEQGDGCWPPQTAPSAHVHGQPGATETKRAHHFECLEGVPVETQWKGNISLSMSVKNTKTKATQRGKGLFHLTF